MSNFKLLATKLWVKILCPTWSFIVNCFYWLFRLNRLKKYLPIKNDYSYLTLNELMSKFKWKADNLKDWNPWVITIVARDLVDDCDGAAVLAKWWYKEHASEGRIVVLYSADGKSGHAVCVRVDNKEFVSNDDVVVLNPNNWEDDLLQKFGNKYSVII